MAIPRSNAMLTRTRYLPGSSSAKADTGSVSDSSTGSECEHGVDFQTAPPWVLDRPPPSRLLLNFKKKGPHFNDIESRGRSIPKVNDQLGLTIWLNFGRKSELQSVHNLRSFILLINSTIRDSIDCGCSAGVGQCDHESSHTPSRRSPTGGGKNRPRAREC